MPQLSCPNPNCNGSHIKTKSDFLFLQQNLLARIFLAGTSLRASLRGMLLWMVPLWGLWTVVSTVLWGYTYVVAMIIVAPVYVICQVAAYLTIVKRKVYQHTCTRCQYTWVHIDPRPDLIEVIIQQNERNLAHARRHHKKSLIAIHACDLGMFMALYRNDYPRGISLSEEALALFRELDDKLGIACGCCNLGSIMLLQGETDRSVPLLEQSVAICRDLSAWQILAHALNSLGMAIQLQGYDEQTEILFKESLVLRRKLGYSREICWDLQGLAHVSMTRGQSERAACLYGSSESMFDADGAPFPRLLRARYERSVAQLRVQLGESAFAVAWGAGWAMTPDQAIAYALEVDTTIARPVAEPVHLD